MEINEPVPTSTATGGTHARRAGASETIAGDSVETAQAGAVRPAMRLEGQADETGDGESWAQLREDIRDASEQSRR